MGWFQIILLVGFALYFFAFFWYGYLDKGEDIDYQQPSPDKEVRARRAEQIVNDYGEALAKSENTFKPKSLLPYSKDRIKSAIFRYISIVIDKKGRIPNELENSLIASYDVLDTFVDDEEADRLNKVENKIRSDGDSEVTEEEASEYFEKVQNRLTNTDHREEIRQHIRECIEDNG